MARKTIRCETMVKVGQLSRRCQKVLETKMRVVAFSVIEWNKKHTGHAISNYAREIFGLIMA
jgi:hypothetical protein